MNNANLYKCNLNDMRVPATPNSFIKCENVEMHTVFV